MEVDKNALGYADVSDETWIPCRRFLSSHIPRCRMFAKSPKTHRAPQAVSEVDEGILKVQASGGKVEPAKRRSSYLVSHSPLA